MSSFCFLFMFYVHFMTCCIALLHLLKADTATNSIRKLQRSNDELQEQIETLQMQLEHLQTR